MPDLTQELTQIPVGPLGIIAMPGCDELAKKVVESTVEQLGGEPCVSKNYKTVLSNEVVSSLVRAYIGNASWSGNVWTLINEMVIRGLVDSCENELAAELSLKTLYAFKSNCAEFINPFDGAGHGVVKYAWTASQFTELIIEVIFGVEYLAKENKIVIAPKLTKELKEQSLSIEGLEIAEGIKADIYIEKGKVSCIVSDKNTEVVYN